MLDSMQTSPDKKYDKFQEQLKLAFEAYDRDNKGYLSPKELRQFLDDLRTEINLDKCDDEIFGDIFKVLDIDGGGTIGLGEFLASMRDVFPLLTIPGTKMSQLAAKIFADFDVDDSGSLERGEFKLLLNLYCDKMGVQRCSTSQINY
jgi:Ca2+-binding EF-hand superfamily protein